MNKDTWIGISGCGVLVAAMVGVFTYERASAQAPGATDAPQMNIETAGPTLSDTVGTTLS